MNATTHPLIPVREGDDLEIPGIEVLPYRRVKILGMGCSAGVAEVEDITTGQVFAQKIFRTYRGPNLAGFKRQVWNEVNVLRRLSSYPHIIRLFATYTSGRDFGMILTPVADSGDLAGYLQAILDTRNHLTTEQYTTLTRAFGCLANGLTFIHKQTVRHKDIKPHNILIHQGYVIYTDFGIALDTSLSDSTTTTGIAEAFTRRYCAPEVAGNTKRNRKSDVFSLGCVFVEVLAVLEPRLRLEHLGAAYYSSIDTLRSALSHHRTVFPRWSELIRLCINMLEPELSRRISAEGLLSELSLLQRLETDSTFSYFCDTCTSSMQKKVEELEMQVMETRARVLGEEHLDTLTSMVNLASTLWNQGRLKEAEELEVQVMETRKKVLGEEHPDTLTSMTKLASTFWSQGRWKEAEELGTQVIETRKRVLGEEHPDTLISMSNLASTFWSQGRWKEAEELGTQVIETRKRVLGEKHPDTLTSMANLASTYRNQGRWKEAEDLGAQVMETRKRVLGEEHPDTLTSMANLASTFWSQGRWKEAEDLGVQVMKTRKRVLGEEHPDTLTGMANLASTYQNQGRWKEAEDLGVQVMKTRKRVLGEEHPDTLTGMANLASTYQNQGRWKEAEDLGVQVMKTRKRVLGEEHPDTLTGMANLASTYQNQGRWKEAEELDVQVMETRKRVLGEEHPNTLTSMHNLAFTLKGQGHNDKAVSLMDECFQLRKQVLGPQHSYTTSSLSALSKWRLENVDISG